MGYGSRANQAKPSAMRTPEGAQRRSRWASRLIARQCHGHREKGETPECRQIGQRAACLPCLSCLSCLVALADIAMLIPGHPRSQSRVRPNRPHVGFLHSARTIRTTRPDHLLRTPSSDGGAPPHRSYRPRQVVSAGADKHITAHPSYVKFLQLCTTAHLDL